MTTSTDKALMSLSSKLDEYRQLDSIERQVFLFWIITQGITLLGAERPVMVGGGVVELYTGVRFATGDLDVVCPDESACDQVLKSIGFELIPRGNHYVNRDIGALVDIHGSKLFINEQTIELVYRKVPLLIVSPEDCIAERLASYRRHNSTLDLLNALLIAHHNKDRLDIEHLQTRIGSLDLWEYYRVIQEISRELVLHESGADVAAGYLIHFIKEGPSRCVF